MQAIDTNVLAEELAELRVLLARLRADIRWRDVRTGRWFTKVQSAYVTYYGTRKNRRDFSLVPLEERATVARQLTDRTALLTALLGLGAAVGVTGASVATVQSAGLAAPVVLPLAGLGVVTELLVRSLLHLQLACELAELYGMPFGAESGNELTRVYALASRAEMHETEDDPGRGLVERVVHAPESGGLGKLIAAGLVGETLLVNAVPFADIAVSSFRNWQVSRQVGRFVQGYAGRRVALGEAVKRVAERSPRSVDALVEGLWFIFISDGRLTGIETALLAHLMRRQSTSENLTSQFVSDEAGWIERLRQIDPSPETRALVLRAFEIAAVVESPVSPSELTVLRRAAETLGVPLSLPHTLRQLEATAASTDFDSEQRAATHDVLDQLSAYARSSLTFVTRAVQLLRDTPRAAAS